MRRHITLPLELDEAAQQAAKDAGLTVSELCQGALRDRLDHQGAEHGQQEAPDSTADRLDNIDRQLRQLLALVALTLAVSVCLAVLAATTRTAA